MLSSVSDGASLSEKVEEFTEKIGELRERLLDDSKADKDNALLDSTVSFCYLQ